MAKLNKKPCLAPVGQKRAIAPLIFIFFYKITALQFFSFSLLFFYLPCRGFFFPAAVPAFPSLLYANFSSTKFFCFLLYTLGKFSSSFLFVLLSNFSFILL
jgi:hypothetical protein